MLDNRVRIAGAAASILSRGVASRKYFYAARRRNPSSGVLSEGDKRDSKGDMPVTLSPAWQINGGESTAAEATLLRSQRLGLGRGGPNYTHTQLCVPVTGNNA